MEMTSLGKTGLKVSRLGGGLARIGEELSMADVEEAGQVLNAALDDGINFLDTAACYGVSEELVGRTVSHRRDEYILATKCGHVTGGASGKLWSTQTIEDSIERSLLRMKTDYLDIVQLHSCDRATLECGEAVEALLNAKRSGKTRFVGFSGDNDAALWAVESGFFDTLQTSFNFVDQRARIKLFEPAKSRGMGIIIKRPVANGVWGLDRSPYGYADEYFSRSKILDATGPILGGPDDPMLAAMGFVLGHSEVDTAIVGTRNPAHMHRNVEQVETKLPVSQEFVREVHHRFDMVGDKWAQLT